MRRWILLAVLFGLVACDRETDVPTGLDAAIADAACVPTCAGRQCGPDGCGGSCGTCPSNAACSNSTGLCTCESDADFCMRQAAECGPVTAQSCGAERTVDCGGCGAALECRDNACVCAPEDDAALCAKAGKACGTARLTDRCGSPRVADCGGCEVGQVCDDATGTCQCDPEGDAAFCNRLGVECGAASAADNCGATRQVAECGPCQDSKVCRTALGQCVACVPETDAQFCTRLGAHCGAVTEEDNCGTQRTVASCGTCPDDRVCTTQNFCNRPGAPLNDTCAAPTPIVFGPNESATFQVDTTTASADANGTCETGTTYTGRDLVYQFTLTATRNVTVATVPDVAGSTARLYYYVRSSCDVLASELACVAIDAGGLPTRLELTRLPPGTYYLWVDTWGPMSGTNLVTVSLSQPDPAPLGDTCALPTSLLFDAQGHAGVSATTVGAANDASGSCGMMNGSDLVYAFILPTDASVWASVRPVGNPGWMPSLYLRKDCLDPASEKACARPTQLDSRFGAKLTAGTWYLFVDSTTYTGVAGVATGAGAFELEVQTSTAMEHDTCAAAFPLLLDPVTHSATVSGDTRFAADEASHSCANASGGDLVFSFEVPQGPPVNAKVELAAGAGGYQQPLVAVRSDCGLASSQLSCAAAVGTSPARLDLTGLNPGTYFVWVDSVGRSSAGPFSLTVTLYPPPPAPANDLCTRAIPLTLDPVTHLASARGTTVTANDDYQGACGSAGALTGGDVVYTFTLTAPASISANVFAEAGDPAYTPALYLRDGCATGATEVSCKAGASNVGRLYLPSLPAGTYYLFVDGVSGSSGPFYLELIAVQQPINNVCTMATALTPDASGHALVTGDTCAATDTSSSNGCGGEGQDLVYKLTTTSTQDVDLSLRFGSGANSILYVRSSCGDRTTERACSNANNGVNSLSLRDLPAGTWYIFVDAFDLICGAFSLDVNVRDPAPGPGNDTCAAPQALAFDANGVATVTGDTRLGHDSGGGSCTPTSGPDLVYAFTLTSVKAVEVVLDGNFTSTLKPALHMRTQCDAVASEVLCTSTPQRGGVVRGDFNRLLPGTYYVWVDSPEVANAGAFTLTVKVSNPPPLLPQDSCVGAVELVFDATGKATASANTRQGLNSDLGSCARPNEPFDGPDLVYYFALTSPAEVRATLTSSDPHSPYVPALYFRSGCGTNGSEAACAPSTSGTATVETTFPAGVWWVVVDGASRTYGEFTLELQRSAPVDGESCLNPIPLVFGDGDIATAVVDTTLAANNSEAGCNETTGADYVFSFTIGSDRKVTVTAAPEGASSSYRPTVYLRSACERVSGELACGSNLGASAKSFQINRLAPGTYYVWLDTSNTTPASHGLARITVKAEAPDPQPPNDFCLQATPVVLDAAGHATITGSTSGAFNEATGSCSNTLAPHTGADVFYSVTLTTPGALLARVQRTSGTTYAPALYLRSGCGGSAKDLDCASGRTLEGLTSIAARSLPAGTYLLAIDGSSLTSGQYTLDVDVVPAIDNETCSSARALTFDGSGVARVRSSNRNAAADYQPSCTTNVYGRELVFSFDLQQPRDVAIQVVPDGYAKPVVYLRSTCDQAATELGCVAKYTSATADLAFANLPAGSYWVFVDATDGGNIINNLHDGGGGVFTLTVTTTAPSTLPANDTCSGAIPLAFNTSNQAVAQVNTAGGVDDYRGTQQTSPATCTAATDGADVAYSFTLSAPATVTATFARDASTPAYTPAVYIRRACTEDPREEVVGCKNTSSASLTVGPAALPAGNYYVIVDGAARTVGKGTLTVTANPTVLAGDNCFNATALTFDATGKSVVTGTTAGAANEHGGNCGGGSAGDVVYALTLSAAKDVDVLLERPTGVTSTFRPAVYLRSDCQSKASELGCGSNTASTNPKAGFVANSLQPGTYYVVVDTTSQNYVGPFQLTVQLRDPQPVPANDLCAGAVPLTFTQGVATVAGDTSAAVNQYAGGCATSSGPLYGNDVAYSFTLTEDSLVTGVVTRTGATSTFLPALYIRQTCDSLATELACRTGSQSATVSVPLSAGTYYAIVDGQFTSAGAFNLQLTATPVVAGDACFNAIPLAFNGNFAFADGDTASSTISNGGEGVCATSGGAKDLVYSFTLGTARKVELEVVGSRMSPTLYVRRSCSDKATEVGCLQSGYSNTFASLVLPNAAAGTYYVWVDGYGTGYEGPFTLTVRTYDP